MSLVISRNKRALKMGLFVCLMFLLFSSAAATCNECVPTKAAYFASSSGLSSGACGYGSFAVKLYGGHTAAALPSIYNDGARCGACYQIRCKNAGLCSKMGTKVVVTDIHSDTSNTTAFVLSKRAFRAMALPGKDRQVLQLGIADFDYTRVPCVYKGQNLAFRVEEFSKFPNYLAVNVLYQGGQTEILIAEVAGVDSSKWLEMSHNYGAVWDTDKAPTGPLQFRFAIKSGFDAQYFYAEQVLPENWKPGQLYNSTEQIDNIGYDECTPSPCKPWK